MTTLSVPLFLVDAFAERAFGGNPAGVCLLEQWPADETLQCVAAEMNQSETAFLIPAENGFDLRWFTPKVEVDLCGHATLASAFVLWHTGRATREKPIEFATRSGKLLAATDGATIELDFPLEEQREVTPPADLIESLGVKPTYVGKSRFDYLVEVASETELRAIAPDFARLSKVDCRGVIVTAAADGVEFDFVSRFFAPACGIAEDPVTGSAHCTLAHHWHERTGNSDFRAFQASLRGGAIRVRMRDRRVKLAGHAVLVARGELLLPTS